MTRAGVLAVVAMAASVLCGPAAAQEEQFEQRMVRGVLGALGLVDDKPPIDYRERAPLVVPPSVGALPQPARSASAQNPAWPKDPDLEARRAAERENRQPILRSTDPRLSNDELRRGTVRAKQRDNEPVTGRDTLEKLSPDQLGFRGWNRPGQSSDQIVFTGEPERARLTEPPPGLRTPSPNQPYGKVGDDKLDDNWFNRTFAPDRVATGRDSGGVRTRRDTQPIP